MQNVLVLDKDRKSLMPCHPARARMMLGSGKAAVYRRYPFTIILKERAGGELQPVELKVDPGSKTSGIALVQEGKNGKAVIWAGEINHRGQAIRASLEQRRAIRRSRRSRKTRYRAPRFSNRRRPEGWLPPSVRHRVETVLTWSRRLCRLALVSAVAVERVKFDTQKMENPEVSGTEYQQGTLAGYEAREYLLEKFHRICVYCGAKDVPLQVEDVRPLSKGGTRRISNQVIACVKCNQKKGNKPIEQFLAGKPELLKKILAQLKSPLKDAAAMNATRYAIGDALQALGRPISFWSGGRTKFNRVRQGYPKSHWVDAACVGESGERVWLTAGQAVLKITAKGHGCRRMCLVDRLGFPRTKAKGARTVLGFKTGDLVRARVPKGKFKGTHTGRIAVRSRASFRLATGKITFDVHPKHLVNIQKADGYAYA